MVEVVALFSKFIRAGSKDQIEVEALRTNTLMRCKTRCSEHFLGELVCIGNWTVSEIGQLGDNEIQPVSCEY